MINSLFSSTLRRTLMPRSSSLLRPDGVNSQSPVLHTLNAGATFRSLSSDTPEVKVVHVSIEEAKSTTRLALKMIGWDDEDAALQAEIMTAAELCGNNQGLVKMYQPSLMAPSPVSAKPTVERETPTSAVIDANQAPGMLAAVTAADLAVEKAQQSSGPISIVVTRNSSTSSGQLAFYVERMARQGFIGIALANSPEFVAAAQGGKPVFGTNPMAVGIPQAGSSPFTVSQIDLTTMASRSGSNSRPLADFEVNITPSDIEDKDALVELRKPGYGTVATKKGHLQSIIPIAAKDSLSSKCPQVLREVFN